MAHGIFPTMVLVGLTGGVAAGKSTVARMLADFGAQVIDADVLARQVVEPGKAAWRDIVKVFGRRMLQPDSTIDRAALGTLVFNNPTQLKRLGAIMHPRIAREQARTVRAIAARDPKAVIVYDAPVLIEAGAHWRMDRIVVVTVDRGTQIARLHARNGLSRAEALRRIRSQMPQAQKVAVADYLIDGTQSRPRLRTTVRKLYRDLSALA